VDPAEAKPLILDLAKQYDGKDRFYLEAIGIAVNKNDPARRAVILADFDKQFPSGTTRSPTSCGSCNAVMMPTLGKRLADKALTPAQRGRIVDILAASNDAAAGASLLKVLETDVPDEVRAKVNDNLKLFLPNKWPACAAARTWPKRFGTSSTSRSRASPA